MIHGRLVLHHRVYRVWSVEGAVAHGGFISGDESVVKLMNIKSHYSCSFE